MEKPHFFQLLFYTNRWPFLYFELNSPSHYYRLHPAKYPQISVTVHAIQNDYFGGTVSVAGLVTGTDIIKQCKGNLSSNILCVPEVMLRDEKDRFLDDLTAKQLGEALGCEIEVIPTDGAGGCKAYLGELKPKPKRKKLHFSFGGR